MKAAVITFPGSNCDDDILYALEISGFEVSTLWHKDSPDLTEFRLVVLPGGFSYGDYLRTGAMAAISPIMQSVKKFAENGGFVLGICNGFQILCESGLLSGALVRNEGLKFVCKDVPLKVEETETPWTSRLKKNETLVYPIAHGDGRYVIDELTFTQMKQKGQIVLTYQTNPNGSIHNIAGICNESKNVFGLMPHPERATDLRSRDGNKLWASLLSAIEEKFA